jgi:DNA-binding NtrC family response regulator
MSEQAARVLIVEDEQIVAVDIKGHLQRLGYHVVGTAVSGDEACQKAAELEPDLVLMDIRIEGPLDGIDTAARLRRFREVPVIFLTAYTDLETLQRAKRIEPYGYIVKPFAQRDLEAALEVALYKAAVDRQLRESRENLQTMLDAQRHGTVMLDAGGRVRFASRAVRRMAAGETKWGGCPLAQLLPVSAEHVAALEAMCQRPADQRQNVPVVLGDDQPRPRHLEIEIIDDPRDAAGRILFVYDVSPLYDLRRQLDEHSTFQHMVGKSRAMRRVFQTIEDLARVDSTVLIEGETGTGKELVARAIHRLSDRRDKPFVALNCAGLSEELAASQLFGHWRGAFTGAVDDQRGLFEAANGGTLFLDEIGELPVRVQTILLRVLEENAVMPLGESALRAIDVRTVAATHRDLAREAAADRFRQDLLYRIRVARVQLPPLCDRREDLPILVRAFLADHRASTGKHVEAVSDDAMAVLMDYPWPGNVRELRNALEFAVIRARGSVIQPEELPPELLDFVPEGASKPSPDEHGLDEADRVKAALKWARGNRTKAARLLGISRATLYRRLRELEIQEK